MVKLTLDRPILVSDINWQHELDRMVDTVLNSIPDQIEAWLKLEFQSQAQFSDLNWSDRELVKQTLYDNGYQIDLSGMGEYILYQNHQEKSRFKIQMNFSR